MNTLTLLLTLLLPTALLGQVTYAPVFMNACTQEAEDVGKVFWELIDTSRRIFSLNSGRSVIQLPQEGAYTLYYRIKDNTPHWLHSYVEHPALLLNQPVTSDTIWLARLREIACDRINPTARVTYKYLYCDNLADGVLKDYYADGSLKIKGKFANGEATDSVFYYNKAGLLVSLFVPYRDQRFYYYDNGQIEQVESDDYTLKKVYYPNGQLKSDENHLLDINKYYYENGQLKEMNSLVHHVEKQYYEDGQLKKIRHFKGYIQGPESTYYANGQLAIKKNKTSCRRYHPEGLLIDKLKRKITERGDKRFFRGGLVGQDLSYRYQWERHNAAGDKVFHITFTTGHHSFHFNFYPNNPAQIDKGYFKEVRLYEQGELMYKVHFLHIMRDIDAGIPPSTKMFLYKKEGKKWVLKEQGPAAQIYTLLKAAS